MSGARLVIVDDEPLVTEQVTRCLVDAGLDVAASAHTPGDAFRLVEELHPDLVVMDIDLGAEEDGVALAARIWNAHRVPIVYLTAHADESVLERVDHSGSFGFIVKPFSPRQLVATIAVALMRARRADAEASEQRLARMERQIDALAAIVHRWPSTLDAGAMTPEAAAAQSIYRTADIELATLSAREREVLMALLDNQRVPAIAEALFISQHTVRNHLKAIFRKFGVSSQQALLDRIRRRPPPQTP